MYDRGQAPPTTRSGRLVFRALAASVSYRYTTRVPTMIPWKKNLYAIWVAELLAIAGFSASMPIIPFYLQDLGVNSPDDLNYWNGLIQSVSAIAMGLVAPVWGRLADNYGRRPMLLRAMFGGGLVVLLMGFVTSPWQLLVLRTAQGLLAGTVGAATVLVAATVPVEQTGFGMGLLQTSVFAGASIGPMIGGFVSDIAGHRATFFVTAAFLMVAGIVVTAVVREEFVPQQQHGRFLQNLVPDFGPVLHSRALMALLFVGFAIQIANAVVNPILPLFIQQISSVRSAVATETGLILGLSALSAALSAAIAGKFSYRVGYRKMLGAMLVGAFLFTLPQAFVHSTMQLLVLRVLGGLFLGGALPSVNALIAENTDRSAQGSVYGINTSVSSAGMALGPALGAIVAVAWGYAAAFVATAAVLLLTAFSIAALAANRTRGRNGQVRGRIVPRA